MGGKIEYKDQKLTNFPKKKGNFRPKKQAGAELKKKKKEFFGSKLGKKLRIMSRNQLILKKKKDFSGQKNKLGLSLRRKKKNFLDPKLGKKLRIMSRN